MGAKVGGASGGKMDEINVTPLIDVVLVLLIIFMVLTPITIEKMASNLPPTDEDTPPPPPDQKDEQLMLAVYEDGTLSLNLKEGSDDQLFNELGQRLRGKEKKTVFIDAAPAANYARVIEVIDRARAAGADKVGFADLKDDGPARLAPGQMLPVPGVPVAPTPPPG